MLFTQDIRKRLEVTKNALFSICRERERERESASELARRKEELSWLVLYMYSCIALQIACLQLAFNNGMVT